MYDRPDPIYSQREDDAQLRDEIHEFVVRLAENVDLLQDTHCEGDLSVLAQRSQRLGGRAQELGYAELSEVALRVSRACEDGKSEDAEAAIVELTGVARRVRLGHRGAAG